MFAGRMPCFAIALFMGFCLFSANALAQPRPMPQPLTAAEREWLRAHPVLRLGGVPSWDPIMMLDSSGKLSGIASEYKALIENKLGVKLELTDYGIPWGEALRRIRKKELDVVMILGQTPERDTYMNFSDGLIDLPYVIITRSDYPHVKGISSLSGKVVAVARNFVAHEWLKREHPEINLLPVETTSNAMEAVALGEADAYVGDFASASHAITTFGITKLKVAAEAGFVNRVRIGVRNDMPELVGILNKAIATIPQSQRDEIWVKWIGLQPHGVDPRLFYAMGALLVAAVFASLAFGGWRLRRAYARMEDMVRERTKELVNANEYLRNSETRFREAIINSPHPAMMHAEGGEILLISNSWTGLTGYSRAEIRTTGLWAQKAFGDSGSAMKRELDESYSLSGIREEGERRITTAKGETLIWLMHSAQLPRLADGRRAALTMGMDVTERKKAEERVSLLAGELARSNEELEKFAFVASHDLQEPLRTVISFLQLLRKEYSGNLGQDANIYINHAVDGARRMSSFIEGLLAYSRVTVSENSPETVNAGICVDDAILALAAAIQESGAVIEKSAMPAVIAVESQLTGVFQNLLANAIKFQPKCQTPRISVSAVPEGAFWEFSVKDNGIGFEPQFQEKIFGMFARNHSRAEFSGSGIGLAVCKKIVENLGGKISAESSPGAGSVFRFTLPAG
ncbi:MAG: transporter substrate-binding domain-containing protein [Nitrospinae bacterium]|nr:transporter substrate-binding domain-containing protein [Nitrospinota bacterium]